METKATRVVICGAGVMGSSIAYQLSLRISEIPNWEITVIERNEVAGAASGKAGGFLAQNWCDRNAVGGLARKSFAMFPVIAENLPGIDYRRVDTLSIEASTRTKKSKRKISIESPEWLDGSAINTMSVMGDTKTTAQVHPAKYTKAMMAAAQTKGVQVRIGCVQGIQVSDNNVSGVIVDGETLPVDIVIISMGPWSGVAREWLSVVPAVSGHKAHSITMHPPEGSTEITAHACFVDFAGDKQQSPEIYPRPDGEVYICGEGDDSDLPIDPSTVKPTEGSCEALIKFAHSMSSVLTSSEVEKMQACYLPISPDGLPIIGQLPSVSGAYIATGHSCWGILNSPATGLVMAELLIDGKATSVDISAFDPSRFQKRRK